jgi:hypothetical protein
MALQEAKAVNINQQQIFFVTNGQADLPSAASFFDVGDWVVNIQPTIVAGTPVAWVVTSVGASGQAPVFQPIAYAGAGGVASTATASTTLATKPRFLFVNGTSAGFTVTLPAIGTAATQASAGYMLAIERSDNTIANPVTIAPSGSDTIKGVTGNFLMYTQGQVVSLVSDGTSWYRQSVSPEGFRSLNPPFTVNTSDRVVIAAAAGTVTMPAATAWPIGYVVAVKNITASLTITPASGNIDGTASRTLAANAFAQICSDGTNYFVVG